MFMNEIFAQIIEPDLEQVPVLEIVGNESGGKTVSHIVRRNVFTDFDRKLSRHLAATRGMGFPAISVSVRERKGRNSKHWETKNTFSANSVPDALMQISEKTLKKSNQVALTIYQNGFGEEDRKGTGMQMKIDADGMEVMRAALTASRIFGEDDFVTVAGDFDMITLAPPGGTARNVTMDLFNRTVSIPSGKDDVIEAPLFDLQRHVEQSYEARAYLGNCRQALLTAKEHAVLSFRQAAEERILRFEDALKGRPLTGHRQEAVGSLVARLKAGLGETLAGLSEHARITALDWSEEIAADNADFQEMDISMKNAEPKRPAHRKPHKTADDTFILGEEFRARN